MLPSATLNKDDILALCNACVCGEVRDEDDVEDAWEKSEHELEVKKSSWKCRFHKIYGFFLFVLFRLRTMGAHELNKKKEKISIFLRIQFWNSLSHRTYTMVLLGTMKGFLSSSSLEWVESYSG